MTCQYASSGCNYPEGECLGLCMKPEFNEELRLRGSADKLNPYTEGSPREAWRRGFLGETNFGAKGSDYDRQYQEGKKSRTAAEIGKVQP